jgi:predicted Zn finger-like uncharacterized protein
MELLTCPACGCSVQVADALLGRRVRCIGCQHTFVAAAGQAPPPPARREMPPLPRLAVPPRIDDEDAVASEGGPFCPGCGRRIGWRDSFCPHCGEELEPEDGPRPSWRRPADLVRRDYEPHHGRLILGLGNLSMIVGGLALCSFGIGAVVSVPVGILAWLMANRDLERMRDGLMDPSGKSQTLTGRTGAIAGVILGVIFSAFYALLYLAG